MPEATKLPPATPSAAAECAGSHGKIVLSGAEHEIAPLTLSDYGDWDMMAQADHLRAARSALRDEDDPLRLMALWREAQSYSTGISFGSIRALGAMHSLSGRLRIVWLALRSAGGKLTIEDVFKLTRAPELMDAVDEVLAISGWTIRGEYKADPRGAVLALVEKMG